MTLFEHALIMPKPSLQQILTKEPHMQLKCSDFQKGHCTVQFRATENLTLEQNKVDITRHLNIMSKPSISTFEICLHMVFLHHTEVVYSAGVKLKDDQNSNKEPPTKRLFRGWWKQSYLHKIKTKPIATVRFTAAKEARCQKLVCSVLSCLERLEYPEKEKNIINFEKAGFRIGCMKGQEILVTDGYQRGVNYLFKSINNRLIK